MIRGSRDAPQDYATPDVLLDALTPYGQDDVQGQWSDERMAMVQALTWNTPESRHESAPERCAATGRVIVSWVRLDNRKDLCDRLSLIDTVTLSDPQIILASHWKWGLECADQLEGDFSFVIYDPDAHSAFCARDSIGAKPIFYHLDKEVFIAGSTAAIFPVLKKLPVTPNRDWMVRFMMSVPHAISQSAYKDVARLAPGHSLTVGQSGVAAPREYFAFQDTAPMADTRDPKYVEAYRDALHRAIQGRLRSDFFIGAENSGGLDSVSINGHAVKHLPHDLEHFHCFGLPTEKRTQELLLEASKHANIRHTHLATHLNIHGDTEAYDRAVKTLGHPVEHAQINMHMSAIRQSEALGVRTMLSGYGGDEIVTAQARAMDMELFRNGQFNTMKSEMPGNPVTRRLRYLRRVRALKQTDAPVARFAPLWERALSLSPVRREVLEGLGIEDDYFAQVAQSGRAKTLNDQLLRDIAFGQCRVGRLEASTLMAQSHRVSYRWPLFDRRLIQCFLQTPAIEKRHKATGRYLHRRAVAGSIPDSVSWQQNKDMGAIIWDGFSKTIPDAMDEASVSPHLSSLVAFDRLRETRAKVQQAHRTGKQDAGVFLQERVLWAVFKLARWLDG